MSEVAHPRLVVESFILLASVHEPYLVSFKISFFIYNWLIFTPSYYNLRYF